MTMMVMAIMAMAKMAMACSHDGMNYTACCWFLSTAMAMLIWAMALAIRAMVIMAM